MDTVTSTQPDSGPTYNLQLFTTIASVGFVFTGVVNTFVGPLLPILAARWTLSDSQAGLFFTTQFLASIFGVSISSILLPRRGFRFTIGFAYLLMAAGVSGLQLSQWRYALLGTFALGLGFGIAIPATNLFISNTNQHRRASALSLVNFCWGLGAAFTPVAIYIAIRESYVSAFLTLLSSILLFLTASLAFVSISESPVAKKKLPDTTAKQSSWQLIATIGGMFFLYVAIESSIGGWIATLAKRASSMALNKWVLAPSLFWGGLLLGRGLAPLVLARVRERNVALAGLLMAGAGMVVLTIASQWQWITVAGFFIGLGLAAVFPITVALLSRFEEAETRNAGPMFALAGLGGATMPWLIGAVSTASGSLRAGVLVPLIGTAILLWLHASKITNRDPSMGH